MKRCLTLIAALMIVALAAPGSAQEPVKIQVPMMSSADQELEDLSQLFGEKPAQFFVEFHGGQLKRYGNIIDRITVNNVELAATLLFQEIINAAARVSVVNSEAVVPGKIEHFFGSGV